MKSIVLLSGGIDSSTALAIAKERGYECYALTLYYGQKHRRELESAKRVAGSIGVSEHRVASLPEILFRGSSLTGQGKVPVADRSENGEKIPTTYVPARNLIFLSLAVGWGEVIGADSVFIGATAVDYSGYPDCRKEFLTSFQETSTLATKKGVEGSPITIEYPLVDMTKSEIILEGIRLGLDYSLTWSCYRGGEKACGECDSCRYRLKGFREAGLEDPLEYM